MFAETVVYMERVFDGTFFSGGERELQRVELTQNKQQRVRIGSMSG